MSFSQNFTSQRLANPRHQRQRGLTLVELMVGIAIGLLVVAVAMGALMVSRGVSGNVSDASGIQQQSAYVMRVIGSQLRQAGSLYLHPNPTDVPPAFAATAAVAFETIAPASGTGNGFDPSTDTLNATATAITVGYRRYKELLYSAAAEQSVARNCVGAPSDDTGANKDDQRIESTFQLVGTALRCAGNGAAAQPIAQNVANFQVRYLLQDNTVPGSPTIRYVNAAAVGTNWGRVQAVEVCLVLYGTERIDMTGLSAASTSYTDCDGATQVDMATLAGARGGRMHVVYRNVFQLRSQGLVGTVL